MCDIVSRMLSEKASVDDDDLSDMDNTKGELSFGYYVHMDGEIVEGCKR